MQKSTIVTGFWNYEGRWMDTTDELNELLQEGYKVESVTPMGAFGYGYATSDQGGFGKHDSGFASLVSLEKE